ncbi:hypothetical protein AB1Y20_003437 [Prymnesium parvum]|uniref:RNA helicase n=1 Tax=Prymnesium parvum TaxID=97485 RepID=A0AB34JDJ8_PRYPA
MSVLPLLSLTASALALAVVAPLRGRGPLARPHAGARAPRALCLEPAFEQLDVRPDSLGAPCDFTSLGVRIPTVLAALEAQNISTPNALQRAAFAPLASGRDAILHAYTGSGKTLAFLLPLLEQLDATSREPQALILCPSRELAFQTYRVAESVLQHSALRAGVAAGGANAARQMEKLRKERPQLLVGTPGRVCELAFEWRKLKLQRVRHLVVDEVDDALQSGNLDATVRVVASFRDGRPLQIIFASATADTPMVRRSAVQLLDSPLMIRLGRGEGNGGAPELPQGIAHGLYVLPAQKHLEAIRQLANSEPKPRCIIFVDSPHRARIICEKLASSYNIDAAPLYGQQEREQKVDVMRKLVEGKLHFVVSTEMGARGLDIPGLTHVVNLDLPTDHQHYVHRAGRTGRAGANGTVISVVAPNRVFVVEKLAKKLGVQLESVSFKGGKQVAAPAKRARPSATSAKRSPRTRSVGGADAQRPRAKPVRDRGASEAVPTGRREDRLMRSPRKARP